ncbi:hypothetical protein K491DRAFT_596444 [Lophiostoma macrostomum CBS 122681]|uniref:TPR-like protein n=1 Tax=Lophiostoma macrostomum CBS 122681 TaxID=1314788 RepID=A0A6A6TCL0_9PLEO|nr:hypothetical protein K491DRAFT_596444 [Lophiostoma macrostomum CBS 122681]
MPPKRKDLLKAGSKSKSKAQDPQSENDFLEAADEFELSAGKWRAGDLAKAIRFFNRGIDMYNAGLQRYPNSFDLAYNKANLEYNMCEDDRVVAALGNRINLLKETLASHRVATALGPENTDVLFNTGQVLTSLAEALLGKETQESAESPASTLLEEAVDLFTRCLASQQQEYEQMQIEIAKANAMQVEEAPALENSSDKIPATQEAMETSSVSSEAPEEWATVIDPVTPETILETCTAQLGALTTLLSLYNASNASSVWFRAQYGMDTAQTKIPQLISVIEQSPSSKPAEEPAAGPTLSLSSSSAVEGSTSPKDDAILAVANFQVGIAEVTYRSNSCTSEQYASQIESTFAPLLQEHPGSKDVSTYSVNVRASYADSLMSLSSAIPDSPYYTNQSPTLAADLEIQWKALTQAQTILTALSSGASATIASPTRLADIFLARGDADLFRFRISSFASAKASWVKSKGVLVANAGVYYRGARSYAEKAGLIEVQKTADAKAIVAEVLKAAVNGAGLGKEVWDGKGTEIGTVLRQMVDEGIMGQEEGSHLINSIAA